MKNFILQYPIEIPSI